MQCSDVMKTDVESVLLTDSAQVAAMRMRVSNVGFLPVCDRSMRVLGTLTDRDLAMRVVAEDLPATTTVDQLLTPDVVSCFPDDEIGEAERLMAEHQKSRVLCVGLDGRLVGVISLSDLAQIDDGASAADTLRQVTVREARGHRGPSDAGNHAEERDELRR